MFLVYAVAGTLFLCLLFCGLFLVAFVSLVANTHSLDPKSNELFLHTKNQREEVDQLCRFIKSYQFHWDSSSSQSESPCPCVHKLPIHFPKHSMSLSIRLGSCILFGCGVSMSLEVPSPQGTARFTSPS